MGLLIQTSHMTGSQRWKLVSCVGLSMLWHCRGQIQQWAAQWCVPLQPDSVPHYITLHYITLPGAVWEITERNERSLRGAEPWPGVCAHHNIAHSNQSSHKIKTYITSCDIWYDSKTLILMLGSKVGVDWAFLAKMCVTGFQLKLFQWVRHFLCRC